MAFLHDRVLVFGLSVLEAEATRLDICSNEPDTFTEATSRFSLGHKIGIDVSAAHDRIPDGKRVTVKPIDDGAMTHDGVASSWALTDTINSRLLAAGEIAKPKSVTGGNRFTLDAFDIGIPDAVQQ